MSPVYTYRHLEENPACPAGGDFEWEQPMRDPPLPRCPRCGRAVERTLSPVAVMTKKFNCELRDLGFTKLARVDDGLYENVTRRPGEDRYVDRRRPETFPDLSKTVKD